MQAALYETNLFSLFNVTSSAAESGTGLPCLAARIRCVVHGTVCFEWWAMADPPEADRLFWCSNSVSYLALSMILSVYDTSS